MSLDDVHATFAAFFAGEETQLGVVARLYCAAADLDPTDPTTVAALRDLLIAPAHTEVRVSKRRGPLPMLLMYVLEYLHHMPPNDGDWSGLFTIGSFCGPEDTRTDEQRAADKAESDAECRRGVIMLRRALEPELVAYAEGLRALRREIVVEETADGFAAFWPGFPAAHGASRREALDKLRRVFRPNTMKGSTDPPSPDTDANRNHQRVTVLDRLVYEEPEDAPEPA